MEPTPYKMLGLLTVVCLAAGVVAVVQIVFGDRRET